MTASREGWIEGLPSDVRAHAATATERWIGHYDADRSHSTFGGGTPDEVYARQKSRRNWYGIVKLGIDLGLAAKPSRKRRPPHVVSLEVDES